MRVVDLATDLGVSSDALLSLLRTLRIALADEDASLSDADVSRVLARVERERRAGHGDTSEAIQAAIEDAKPASGRARRRRRVVVEEKAAEEAASAVAEEETGVAAEESEQVDDAAAVEDSDAESEEISEAETQLEVEPAAEVVESVEAEAEVLAEVETQPEVETQVEAAEQEAPPPQAELEEAAAASTEAGEAPAPEVEAGAPRSVPAPARAGAPVTPARPAGGEGRRIIKRPGAGAPAGGTPGQVRVQAEGYTPDGQRKARKDKKKRARVDNAAVKENIQRVMAELKGGGKKRRRRSSGPSKEELEVIEEEQRQEEEKERRTVRVNEFLTVAELAGIAGVSPTLIVGSAFKNLGLMITINQRLDFEQIELFLDELGFEAIREEAYQAAADVDEVTDDAADLLPRPPVVTVMGHVDHGKTLLLDSIRKTNVVAGESGGITQHIGAYNVEVAGDRTITFLDTPGHSAFTAMRARGADVTDLVVLVVAADDSVMPQTREAISHARNADAPIIVAINKCDLPAADANKVKQELLQYDVQVEDFGGSVLAAEVSAKTGEGVEDLLDKILLHAEMMELSANPNRPARGTVIEAQLDVGKGAVVTVLVQKGTLRVGDSFVVGSFDGRVRAMLDERGKTVTEAGPSIPVQVLGAGGVPQAGDVMEVMPPAKAAEIAGTRQRLERDKQLRIKDRGVKLGDLSAMVEEGRTETLPLVLKADVDGSAQALADALEHLGTKEVAVHVVHRGVGAINESDVLLAATAGAVIIGFRVRPDTGARQSAERQNVEIRAYDVIYDAVDEVKLALEGMLAPERREEVIGSAEVREIFKVSKVGTIGGSVVQDGVIDRKERARLIRGGIVVYDGEFSSLKRFKDDVKEVRDGFECGIGILNFNDIKVGDVIECYKVEEIARTLEQAEQIEA